MRKLAISLICLSVFFACGRDKKEEPRPAPTPVPAPAPAPAPTPKPVPPEKSPFPCIPNIPIPGIPSIPDIPGIPRCSPSPSPSPAPSPVPAPSPGKPVDGDVAGVGEAVNKARASRGLSAVEILPALNCAAARHAKDTGSRGMCSHTGSDGSSPWDRAKDCGTFANGEIIACGQGDATTAVNAWTLSPGHAAIMYDGGQKKMGVGMSNNYWVVIFQK